MKFHENCHVFFIIFEIECPPLQIVGGALWVNLIILWILSMTAVNDIFR